MTTLLPIQISHLRSDDNTRFALHLARYFARYLLSCNGMHADTRAWEHTGNIVVTNAAP